MNCALKRIDVISLFPTMFDALRCGGISARAIDAGLLELVCWNPRDFSTDKHRRVDDRPYGGGPGMVMQAQALSTSIEAARADVCLSAEVVYLSPQGRRLDQIGVRELLQKPRLILLCGRYEGIDERLISQQVDSEYSIGDYVLSGGELPAMVLIDALIRWLPDALGDSQSATQDSFAADGMGLLDCPQYTRPADYAGMGVPQVLLSGDHAAIARWRLGQSLWRTWQRRPDLLAKRPLTETEQQLLLAMIENQWQQANKQQEDC
jgi:tRNA (guanine37-N1)-methyltransferase